MADPLEIAQQLLRRLAGIVSDGDVARWAEGLLKDLEKEGPSFGSDNDSMADVLKKCSVAGRAGFGLTPDDLRWLLLRLASLRAPLLSLPERGRFLACRRRGRFIPSGSGVVSNCRRCAAQVVFPESRLPKLRDCDGRLLCWRCARTLPGRIVEIEIGPG